MPTKADKLFESHGGSASDKLRIHLLQAMEHIGQVIGVPPGGGIPPGGSTLDKQDEMIALLTGAPLTLVSAVYTDAVPHNTIAGKNTVMITCENGVEEINGIVRSIGVYTFQPTGNDSNAVFSVNANNGRLIVDQL